MHRAKVAFEPLAPGEVGMYVCGPTPYAPAHIGHAFSAISFDTIRRALQFLGYRVRYVRNVTDVEDKIIKRANELGEDPMALAARFAADYNRDMARFGVMAPDVEPKVSTHIPEIIALIEKLIANERAYAVDGDVYYACERFAPYGKLSGQSLEDLRAGARVEVDERKQSPADFALWKAAKPGEPWWESPWGKGRPGWHIECSAMTTAHLGVTFDLHGGGKDLIFPHHENEIAQSQGAYGEDTFARHWMHNGFLNFGGVKMSKSLGNVFNCDQIADAVGGEALRFFCVEHHYRSPVDFEVEEVRPGGEGAVTGVRFRSLEAADRRLEKFYVTLQKIDRLVGANADPGAEITEVAQLRATAREGLADDFNAPIVMAALHVALTHANRLLDETKGDKALRKRSLAQLAAALREVGAALGILADDPARYLAARRDRLVARNRLDVPRVEQLLADRAAARAAKDFTRADAVRTELAGLGVSVLDTPAGTDWTVQDAG
ncbi:MAG: cysteine--tRNA ligase [Deltaproteobacteria bacterium]|nr:cysteine--tRNA ligase [Deltaproteobacteria bacterium]MCW5803663.1 cysteine--tRNA ligase [Deltaproteobacteria bacterium]